MGSSLSKSGLTFIRTGGGALLKLAVAGAILAFESRSHFHFKFKCQFSGLGTVNKKEELLPYGGTRQAALELIQSFPIVRRSSYSQQVKYIDWRISLVLKLRL
jgi:hypothetical protein